MASGFINIETPFAEDDQVTHTNLNAAVNAARPLKAGSTVDATGNTTDETTCDLNANGEIIVKSGGIGTAQIADDAITAAKMADNSVGTASILTGAVSTVKILGDAVTEAKIADGAVQSEHLADEIISGQTELDAAPADEDEILLSDGGVLKKLGIDSLMKHPAIAKCAGRVTWDGSAATVTGDFNVSSVTLNVGATPTVRVVFTNGMDSINYVVLATHDYDAGADAALYSPYVHLKHADHFDLSSAVDAVSGVAINFVVFGTLA